MSVMKSEEGHMCVKYVAGAVLGFGGACCTLLTLSATDEKISVPKGLAIMSMGLVFFASLAESIETAFHETRQGRTIQQRYRLLQSDIIEITNKIVSATQAILSTAAGVIVCNWSCRRSFLHASHFMSDAYAWFGTAYFVYDMWHMYRTYKQKIADKLSLINRNDKVGDDGDSNNENNNLPANIDYTTTHKGPNEMRSIHADAALQRLKDVPTWPVNFLQFCWLHPVMIIHHVFLGSFGLFVIVYLRGKFGDCVYSFMFLMELSTPCVCIRGILSTLGLKKTTAYVINGIAMIATFFVCRILMWPTLYIWYSRVANVPVVQAIISLPLSCKIGTLILFVPQIYWFYLMIRGAVKILFRSKTDKTLKTS